MFSRALKTSLLAGLSAAAIFASSTSPVLGADIDEETLKLILAKLEKLEKENAKLSEKIKALETRPTELAVTGTQRQTTTQQGTAVKKASIDTASSNTGVGLNSAYSYKMLDHAEDVNLRQLIQLEARRDNDLDDLLTISTGITALADAHWTNSANKFGYLMRHPTGNNQRTKSAQGIVVHNAQLALTATPTDDVTAYIEMLYDPEQSFGTGTITDVNRNQVQVRKAYMMWGNLQKSPFYAAAGKMDVPFGLQDTVNPFTNSTNWHAFAPLAYGGLVGYYDGNLSVRGMAVVGGAQFRAANTPVDDTNVPSKLNNFAIDASYRHDMQDGYLRLGASYIRGSAYCQDYPVFHFMPCTDNNPAWAVYTKAELGQFDLIGEFAKTTDVWKGTAVPEAVNPELAVFEASKVHSFTFGGRYRLASMDDKLLLSGEFSKYKSGDKGAPWERQNQWVAGVSYYITPYLNVFSEFVHTDGWVPLNFLSGGNQPNGATWSERDAKSDILVFGVQGAF